MKGKERCRILKEIRQRIADENGIEFITSECKHKGDCRGTCPKCEAEVEYLERELMRRQRLGKSIAVAGIAASLVLTGVSCSPDPIGNELDGDMRVEESTPGLLEEEPSTDNGEEELMGEPVEDIQGAIPYIDENGEEALNPEISDVETGELPEYFFPDDITEYDDYSQSFIEASMAGMTIDQVKAVWGDGDMSQSVEDNGIVAYFTDAHDIVIQYKLETGVIIHVTTIENDE